MSRLRQRNLVGDLARAALRVDRIANREIQGWLPGTASKRRVQRLGRKLEAAVPGVEVAIHYSRAHREIAKILIDGQDIRKLLPVIKSPPPGSAAFAAGMMKMRRATTVRRARRQAVSRCVAGHPRQPLFRRTSARRRRSPAATRAGPPGDGGSDDPAPGEARRPDLTRPQS